MIEYWPYRQGISLNNAVAELFTRTKKKLNKKIINKTNSLLSIDILDTYAKKRLISITIEQLEIMILEITELNLQPNYLKSIIYPIFQDLKKKTLTRFLQTKKNFKKIFHSNIKTKDLQSLFILKNKLLLDHLLIYLIFGSSKITKTIFMFDLEYTPKQHVKILLENFILEFSNIITYSLLQEINNLPLSLTFLKEQNLCSPHYLSPRSLAMFKNNLFWQHLIYAYLYQPKEIYSSKQKIWLLSYKGIITKYIFLARTENLSDLSKVQIFFLLFLEIQDILIPKLEYIALIITKIILYIIINLFGNSILIITRAVLNQINQKNV